MVEVDQFGFRQPVNVDHHEAAPSALNGVSILQRLARSGQGQHVARAARMSGLIGAVIS
jgi:hypothetical protein